MSEMRYAETEDRTHEYHAKLQSRASPPRAETTISGGDTGIMVADSRPQSVASSSPLSRPPPPYNTIGRQQ